MKRVLKAPFAAAVTPVIGDIQLIRLHGKLSIKPSADLGLYMLSPYNTDFGIMDKSIFTMYLA